MATNNYDWNKEATLYTVVKQLDDVGEQDQGEKAMVITTSEPPTDAEAIKSLVQEYSLTNGDIINFDDYRYLNSYIVLYNQKSDVYTFLKNKDESAAAYLTIPEEVLENVTDAFAKYKNILEGPSSAAISNMHLSPKDEYVKNKFDCTVPSDWGFDICVVDGAIDCFCYKPSAKGSKWQEHNSGKLTESDIQKYA